MYNEQLTQALAVLGWKAPASLSGATDTSITDVDIAKYKRLLFVIQIGTNATSVDAKLRESKTSGGTYQDFTTAIAITQVTVANKIVTIEVRADQLDAGYEFVQLSVTTVGASICGFLCLGGEGVHKPVGGSGPANDIAAVTQRLVA
jgi:hypothetical protein